jgi:hypothetical protein
LGACGFLDTEVIDTTKDGSTHHHSHTPTPYSGVEETPILRTSLSPP